MYILQKLFKHEILSFSFGKNMKEMVKIDFKKDWDSFQNIIVKMYQKTRFKWIFFQINWNSIIKQIIDVYILEKDLNFFFCI